VIGTRVVHTADNHRPGIVLALSNIGYTYARMNGWARAFSYLEDALDLARKAGELRLEAGVLQNLGETHLAVADHDRALGDLEAALAIRLREALAASRELGDRHLETATLAHLRVTPADRQ